MQTKKKLQYQKWLKKNREYKRAYQKKYDALRYQLKKDEINQKNRESYRKNKKVRKQKAKLYYQKTKKQAVERAKRWAKNNPKKVLNNKKRYIQNNWVKRRMTVYKSDASKRGYSFRLSEKTFESIITSPCFYCGKEKSNGVDRKNNKVGYVKQNCLPCCGDCNRMKWSHSYDDFLEKVSAIYKNCVL